MTAKIDLVPAPQTTGFQQGTITQTGTDHAALEGQIHMKLTEPVRSVIVVYRTVETTSDGELELANAEHAVYTNDPSSPPSPPPATLSFSIPLAHDTPQSLRTPISSLSHSLTARLKFHDDSETTPFNFSRPVFLVRASPHDLVLPIQAHTERSEAPTPVSVELSRTTYFAGETLPVYVTVPPPARALVQEQGLRLRNIRVELVRDIRVLASGGQQPTVGSSKSALPATEDRENDPLLHRTVVARSGAPCRFHSTRAVQLRFLLRIPNTPSPSDHSPSSNTTSDDYATISQETPMHSVTFALVVHVAFLSRNPGTSEAGPRTEGVSTIRVPLELLPPSATPPPVVEDTLDEAYAKKHDAPPTSTTRRADTESEPGPLVEDHHQHGPAPPPFDDAPPSFAEASGSSSSALPSFAEASSSSALPTFAEASGSSSSRLAAPSSSTIRLPSFTEAETSELFSTSDVDPDILTSPPPPTVFHIPGEGLVFGFLPSSQFDGTGAPDSDTFADLAEQGPPPTITAAMQDTALDPLTGETTHVPSDTLVVGLDHHDVIADSHASPPPPPPMDDPSDPPPGIDDARFHTRDPLVPPGLGPIPPDIDVSDQPTYTAPPVDTSDAPQAYSTLPPPETTHPDDAVTIPPPAGDSAHAPPPYVIPQEQHAQSVPGPPPYVN